MKDNEERVYTVPLRDGYIKKPRWRKTHFAVKKLKKFVLRHTKLVPKIEKDLNEEIWKRGGKNPPPRVKVKIKAEKGFAKTSLAKTPIEKQDKEQEAKSGKE